MTDLSAALEAILFSSNRPLKVRELQQAVDADRNTVEQPVSRSRIEEVRGVNCESVLANLELRDLIAEVGRGSGPGQPKLYGTTMRFLQVMGLESLDSLPTPKSDGLELIQRASV
jgi:chromosome segregation and condensation protein ScpB